MNRQRKAFSILEVVIALALLLLILTMLGSYASFSVANLSLAQGQIRAEAFSEEAYNLAKSVARRDWLQLNTGVGSLRNDAGVWNLAPIGTWEQLGDYQRRLSLEAICRDANQLVVDCSVGTVDPDSYRLSIIINWSDWAGSHEVQRKTYLSNWH